MSSFSTLNVKKTLINDIESYCALNDIKDIQLFCNQLLEKAFIAEKYGEKPGFIDSTPKPEPKKVVYEPEKVVSLPNESTIPEPKVEEKSLEIEKTEPTQEPQQPQKIFKKVNLNDDYKVYDIR